MRRSGFDREFARTRRRIDRTHNVVRVGISGTLVLVVLVIAALVYWVSTTAKGDIGSAIEWVSARWRAGQ